METARQKGKDMGVTEKRKKGKSNERRRTYSESDVVDEVMEGEIGGEEGDRGIKRTIETRSPRQTDGVRVNRPRLDEIELGKVLEEINKQIDGRVC
jgi:hypothetical protein